MDKVVHFSSAHSPYDNRILFKQCISLSKHGFNVVYIVPHSKNEVVEGVSIKNVQKPKNRFERILFTNCRIYRKLKKENGDVYHFHDPELLLVGFILSLQGNNVIFDMHENVPKSIRNKYWIPKIIRKAVEFIYRLIEKIILPKLTVIFAENSYQIDYAWLLKTQTVLNFPKLDQILSINTTKNKKASVGYIGSISENRGNHITLQALSKLKKEKVEIAFQCVGKGAENYLRSLKKLSDDLNIETTFYGFKPYLEGLKIIKKCHVGLALLESIPNYRESQPTKIFEYMALGIPVIASDFPLYKAIVEKNKCGICVDPTDVKAIANALKKILWNPELAKEWGLNGQKAARKKYSWQSEEDKLINLYKSILGRR